MKGKAQQKRAPGSLVWRSRRLVWLVSVMLLGSLLHLSISGCGRKGPPKPLRQQAPSERALEH